MTVLIATDVFGSSPAIASLVRSLACTCLVVSPYDQEQIVFHSEQIAYHAFLAEGGVARYAAKVTQLLQDPANKIRLAIGFSAGASALWIASASPAAANLAGMTLFYGSRIRDHQDVQALCPVRLIFAEHETAFDAAQLSSALLQKGRQAELAKGSKHGFMNPYSRGFCLKTQAIYLQQLIEYVGRKDAASSDNGRELPEVAAHFRPTALAA